MIIFVSNYFFTENVDKELLQVFVSKMLNILPVGHL